VTLDEENLDAIAQDVNDLLEMIKRLELRIIELEKFSMLKTAAPLPPDGWYFDY